MKPILKINLILSLMSLLTVSVSAQNDDFEASIEEEEESYQWETPAGAYLKPGSFFSLHGYVNAVYGSKSDEWINPDPTQLGAPGQLLVPKTNNSSFQYDAALVMSSALTSRTAAAIEMHLVSDPSGNGAAGPGGLTIALTEATASYDIIPEYLTFSGGLFWAPFGLVNQDWLGAQNTFSLLPRASGAIPIHFNERGIRLNGAFSLSDNSALNYVFSIGNGLNGFGDIRGQNSFDFNSNKTATGRIGVFPGMRKDLELGVSFLNGIIRENSDPIGAPGDITTYASTLEAFGLDATFNKNDLTFRSYFILSNEKLGSNGLLNPSNLSRTGFMLESKYLIKIETEAIYGVSPKARFDFLDVENLTYDGTNLINTSYSSFVVSLGMNLNITEEFRFSFDYNIAAENGQDEIDNNRFFGKITANF